MLEGLTSSGIMQMVSQANREIENWNIEIFGDMEKDAEGNLVQKQWTIPRSDSKTIHATENSEVKSAYEKLMNNEQNQKDKARYEELSKREYESLTESEKEELNNLSRNLVTVRDGKLGEWIGYAPMFRRGIEGDELDLEKGIDYNLADKGLGQMGAIMLDFQWNSMRASQGWAKLSLPMYDQPLWKNNGSFFEPPTLRSVSSVVMEIVGTATGQSWWLGYADDLLFAAMDVGGGYKSASEVGLELAKTAATAVIGKGIGAGSNALGDLAGKAMQGAGKVANFAVQAGISMTTNYVTSVANSAVQSLYIGENGLAFNSKNFTKSLYSTDTISGALGAGITAGLNVTTIGYNNQYVNGFNSQQIGNIKTFNSLMGGLTTNTSSLLMGGNANFNLLNYKGVGMLEFSFGKDGISSKIGMGGTNISMQNLVGAFGGATNLHKNSQINKTGYDKTTLDALRSQWGFGDEVAKDQLDDIINGDTVLKFDAEGSEVAQSITENGQKIIHINSTLNDGFIDLGLNLQHEAHRDGIVGDEQSQQIETTKAVLGHTVMAKKMQNDSLYKSMMNDIIDTNQNLQNDLAVFDYAVETGDWGAFGSYANAAYDSSADYWKLVQREDGSFGWAWDGDFDFNINGIGKISAEKMKTYSDIYKNILEGTVVIIVGSITSGKIPLNTIAALHKEAENNSFMQFISGTEGFADASIAAKMLESGNLSQENINAMNAGLYAAQRSGLLVKNDYSAIMANGLVGSGTIDNPYLPLTGNVLVTCLAGYRFVTEDFYNSLKKDSRKNFPLNEFAKNNHLHTDIISDNFNIVTSVEGAVKLNYDDTWGLNGTNYSSDGYMAFLSNHMDPSSIKNYVALFGMEGTNINQANNGSYYLNGIKAGSVYGQMGQTGISGGKHVDFGIYQTKNPFRLSLYNDTRIDFESIFKIKNKDNINGYEYTIDTWAKYYSGMPTDNIFDNYPSINNYLFNWTIKNVPNYSTLPYRG